MLNTIFCITRKLWRYLLPALTSLSLVACGPEPVRTVAPTLNLITGCFDAVSATGERYLLIGCLSKPELDGLRTQSPKGFVADNTALFQADYADAVHNGDRSARQPTLNLVTGCFEGQDRILLGRKEVCPVGFDPIHENFISARVMRRIDSVLLAYHGQMAIDFQLRPRGPDDITASPLYISTPVMIL